MIDVTNQVTSPIIKGLWGHVESNHLISTMFLIIDKLVLCLDKDSVKEKERQMIKDSILLNN